MWSAATALDRAGLSLLSLPPPVSSFSVAMCVSVAKPKKL